MGHPYPILEIARQAGLSEATVDPRPQQSVLHHDLRQDMRRACQLIMQAHGALPEGTAGTLPSAIQVITPYNMDPMLLSPVNGPEGADL